MEDKAAFTWTYFLSQVKSIGIIDVIDILIVAILLYYVYSFIRDRRAGKLAVGVALFVVVMLLSNFLGLSALSFITANFFQVGFVALLVVFQPELRSALEKVGGEPLRSLRNIGESKDPEKSPSPYISEICRAAEDLSESRTGALIVLERTTKLGDIIKTGVTVNADISSFVLKNIFYEGAPLHDGAVIIRGWRVYAAGCFLPLSANENIIKDLGTRHRAGIGMSEESDVGGQLKRGFTYNSLKRELENLFILPKEKSVSRFIPHIKKDSR